MIRFRFMLILSILLSACSNENSFESFMRQGKDALHAEDYQAAQQYFDSALIERPNDKDALALAGKTQDFLEKQTNMGKYTNFSNDTEILYERLSELGEGINTLVDNIAADEAEERLNRLNIVIEDLNELSSSWSRDEVAGTAFNHLQQAAEQLAYTLEGVVEAENNPATTDAFTSRHEAFKSNLVQTRVSFSGYKYSLEDYLAAREEIKTLDNTKD